MNDLKKYKVACSVEKIDEDSAYEQASTCSGLDLIQKNPTYLQVDQGTSFANSRLKGIEVLEINDAIKKYPKVKKLHFSLIDKEKDEYTKDVYENGASGYFVRAKKGAKAIVPVQTCLFMTQDRSLQRVHNILIAEPGSELHIISGCAVHSRVKSGMHIGLSEFFVEQGATMSFTMIHNWAEQMMIRPRSVAKVARDARFISSYLCIKPLADLQMYPTAILDGEDSYARFHSILHGKKNSRLDVGSRVQLNKKGARAEIISRAISEDSSRITARGDIQANSKDVFGHLECTGLQLSDDSSIHAIPELSSRYSDVDLSHEASIGKLGEEQLNYLQSRGFSLKEAKDMLIHGFMDVKIPGLPNKLQEQMQRAIKSTEDSGY